MASKFAEAWRNKSPYAGVQKTSERYVVRDGMGDFVYNTRQEAEQMIENLRFEGRYASLVKESFVDMEKSREHDEWDDTMASQDNARKHNGDEINFVAEYKDSEGRINHRFFNSADQLYQFKEEMKGEVTVTQIFKSVLEKPAKFDRCVQHVNAEGSARNGYAVCNAMLSDKSFADMPEPELFAVIDKAIGVEEAGPIPHSLLGRQDLEGEERKSVLKHTNVYDLAARIKGNQKPSKSSMAGKSFKDAWANVPRTNTKVYKQ